MVEVFQWRFQTDAGQNLVDAVDELSERLNQLFRVQFVWMRFCCSEFVQKTILSGKTQISYFSLQNGQELPG